MISTNIDSFLNGQYMSANPNINPRLSRTSVLLVVPFVEVIIVVSVPLANIPIKRTATVYAIITI